MHEGSKVKITQILLILLSKPWLLKNIVRSIYLLMYLKRKVQNKYIPWDMSFMAYACVSGCHCYFPAVNQIKNVGWGPLSTHCQSGYDKAVFLEIEDDILIRSKSGKSIWSNIRYIKNRLL